MLLTAVKIPNGYTWTLVSRLSDMLRRAEEMFGDRDKKYTILGIEFNLDNPRVWYPGNCFHIAIQLNQGAAANEHQACFQLSHETIHLLAPSGGQIANNFEEGLAEWFSRGYMATVFQQPSWRGTVPSYIAAYDLVKKLLDEKPDFIKEMRKVKPQLYLLEPKDLTSRFPSLSAADATYLCGRFVR